MTRPTWLSEAAGVRVSSLDSRIAVASVLLILGSVLAFDVMGISSRFHRDSRGFRPWGRRRPASGSPNTFRAVGAFFLIGAIIAFISIGVKL